MIWIGYDPREAAAFAVARNSVKRHLTQPIPVRGLVLSSLQADGLYTRPIEYRPGFDRPVMYDVISDAPMSTEHANARFLVPHISSKAGWSIFMDGDMLARTNLARACDNLDKSKAVYCVQHQHTPTETHKMDGQVQTVYSRKNWSSFMAFNCGHPSNQKLTVEMVNTLPGRDLHRFCWLNDDEIGALDPSWNFLVGHSDPSIDPKVVHFTDGVPDMRGYEAQPFANEWRAELHRWAA